MPVRVLLLAAAALALALPVAAAAKSDPSDPPPGEDRPVEWAFDLNAGTFSGKYGTETSTRIDLLVPRLRWVFPRGEFSVRMPYYRLSNTGNVTLIGGSPVPGIPGLPGGLPPGVPAPPGGGEETTVVQTVSVAGVGDASLQGEYYFVTGSRTRPWVSGLARVKVPTGDEEKGLGTGETDYEAGLALIQPLGRTYGLLEASHTWIGSPDGISLDDVVRVAGGVSVPVGNRPGSYVYGLVENRSHPVPGYEDQRLASLGFSHRFGPMRSRSIAGAVFVGLSDTAEDFGLSLRLGF
jgi:hypothetical protein